MQSGRPVANGQIARVLWIVLLAAGSAFGQLPDIPPMPPPSTAAANTLDGGALFAMHCAKCHGETGEGISGYVTIAGPSLKAEHDHGEVMMAMQVGPSHMPSFAKILSIEQMRAVANFVTQTIATIPQMKGDLGEGGELFRVYCAPCHRTAVRGGALVYTGVNAPSLADLSPAMLAGAIRWGPGPMPAFPATVLTDKEVNSIVDYIQVVQHPTAPGGTPMQWFGPVAEGFIAWVMILVLFVIVGWIEKGGQG